MNPAAPPPASPPSRHGIDTVEIARIERMLRDATPASLGQLFNPTELRDAGDGPGRAASLAARFAAKEACCKLFPRETALQLIAPPDFSVQRDNYGAPTVRVTPSAQSVLDRYRVAAVRLSLTHTS